MNTRIRELMSQAGFDPAAIDRMGVMPNAEKFAELVVLECIAKIESEAAQYHEPTWAFELVDDIKKHFGVKP
jgi:hypothetical protein